MTMVQTRKSARIKKIEISKKEATKKEKEEKKSGKEKLSKKSFKKTSKINRKKENSKKSEKSENPVKTSKKSPKTKRKEKNQKNVEKFENPVKTSEKSPKTKRKEENPKNLKKSGEKSGDKLKIDKKMGISTDFDKIVEFTDDEEGEKMSNLINSFEKIEEPENYQKLVTLWHSIVKGLNIEIVKNYYEIVRKMLLGRISMLTPISSLVQGFPEDLTNLHFTFFQLISNEANVYPFSYHQGTKLISKHFIGGVNEVAAVSILCSLFHGVMPLNINENRPAITRISSIIRTQIKDALEKAVNESSQGPINVEIPNVEI